MKVRYNVVDGEIVSENRAGVKSFYVPDGVGSTIAIEDITGLVTDRITYWPYGAITNRTGSAETPLLFVGNEGYHRLNNTLSYVRARYLDHSTNRWTSTDPIINPAYLNLYVYCANRPTYATDPSGLKIKVIGNSTFEEEIYSLLVDIYIHGPNGRRLVQDLLNSPLEVRILEQQSNDAQTRPLTYGWGGGTTGSTIWINPNDLTRITERYRPPSLPPLYPATPTIVLAHELAHAWIYSHIGVTEIKTQSHEMTATMIENLIRREFNMTVRTEHDGIMVPYWETQWRLYEYYPEELRATPWWRRLNPF